MLELIKEVLRIRHQEHGFHAPRQTVGHSSEPSVSRIQNPWQTLQPSDDNVEAVACSRSPASKSGKAVDPSHFPDESHASLSYHLLPLLQARKAHFLEGLTDYSHRKLIVKLGRPFYDIDDVRWSSGSNEPVYKSLCLHM